MVHAYHECWWYCYVPPGGIVDTWLLGFPFHEHTHPWLYVAAPTCTLAGLLYTVSATERSPLMHPGPLSDGQFYSPPESVAGQFPMGVVMLLEHPANQGGVSDLPLPVSYYQLKLNLRCKLVCGWKSCYIKVILSASCFMVTVRSAPQTLMKNWTINTIQRRGWSSGSPSRCPELLQELLLASLVCLYFIFSFCPSPISFHFLCLLFLLLFFLHLYPFSLFPASLSSSSFTFSSSPSCPTFFPFMSLFLFSGRGPQRDDRASPPAPKGKLLPYTFCYSDFKSALLAPPVCTPSLDQRKKVLVVTNNILKELW